MQQVAQVSGHTKADSMDSFQVLAELEAARGAIRAAEGRGYVGLTNGCWGCGAAGRARSVVALEAVLATALAVVAALLVAWLQRPTGDDRGRIVLAGIRRAKGTARKQAAPLTADLLRQVVADLDPAQPVDCRDAALLLVGFVLAGRRCEVVALNIADVEFCHGGMRITIAKSKTDQERAGAVVGVPTGANASTCPVAWLRRWLAP